MRRAVTLVNANGVSSTKIINNRFFSQASNTTASVQEKSSASIPDKTTFQNAGNNGNAGDTNKYKQWEYRDYLEIIKTVTAVAGATGGLFWGSAYLKSKEEAQKNKEETQLLKNILQSNESKAKFIEALLSDDIDTVLTLMRMGVNVTKRNPNGSTLVHFAATCAGENVFRELCKTVKTVDSLTDRNGFTPLHRAVFKGNKRTVQVLLSLGLDCNKADATGYTPLHMAAYMGFGEIVNLLVEAGADPDLEDYHDQTPYDYANSCGYSKIAGFLKPKTKLRDISYEHPFLTDRKQNATFEGAVSGSDPFVKIKTGTALHAAASRGDLSLIRELINHAKKENCLTILDDTNEAGETALITACVAGRVEIVEALLEAGANPDIKMVKIEDKNTSKNADKNALKAKEDNAPTALHIAASLTEKEAAAKITKLLLAKINRNTFPKEKAHWSPVHRAAAKGNVEVLKLLLDSFYDVNIYSDSWTPLHEAVCSGQVEAVKFLVGIKKINLSPQEECGETPLHIAVKKYDVDPEAFSEIINILISAGAFLVRYDNDRKTPADYAYYLSNWDIYNRLRQREAQLNIPIDPRPFYERDIPFTAAPTPVVEIDNRSNNHGTTLR